LPWGGGWLGDVQCWELGLLVLKWRIFGFLVREFAVLLIVFLGNMMQLLEVLRATGIVGWMLSATVGACWRGVGWFVAVLRRMLFITFHTLWGATTKIGGVTKSFTVKTLSNGS